MISCKAFLDLLSEYDINFFAGVPDSLLSSFIAYLTDHIPEKNNIITCNEGNAIACATGYYLSTGKPGAVYMQNSGLGNCINPLTSLADKEVYSIPMLLIVGWRGEPGMKDEPQHSKQGRVTCGMLENLEIPYSILPDSIAETRKTLKKAIQYMAKDQCPYALLVRKDSFESYTLQDAKATYYPLKREEAIRIVLSYLKETDVIVSTTGKTSRELFELRERLQQGHACDFLTVGSMGHASGIALGIALQQPSRNVYCFDGDGAFIMHMGSLTSIGKLHPSNFRHVVFNNFAHESVGGQPTAADVLDVSAIAEASGYETCLSATTEAEIKERLEVMQNVAGPSLLEIRVNIGSRGDLGRPKKTPKENKEEFMNSLNQR